MHVSELRTTRTTRMVFCIIPEAKVQKTGNNEVICQPVKNGEGIGDWSSSRPDNVLSLLACANSINFQDLPSANYVSICTGSRLFTVITYPTKIY